MLMEQPIGNLTSPDAVERPPRLSGIQLLLRTPRIGGSKAYRILSLYPSKIHNRPVYSTLTCLRTSFCQRTVCAPSIPAAFRRCSLLDLRRKRSCEVPSDISRQEKDKQHVRANLHQVSHILSIVLLKESCGEGAIRFNQDDKEKELLVEAMRSPCRRSPRSCRA
jgi:hypothetical protein